jgi:hypothetical protein
VQQRYDIGYAQCMSAKGNSVSQPAAQTAYAAGAGYGYPGYYPYYAPYPYYGPAYYGPAFYGPSFIGIGFGFHGGHGGFHHH